MEINKRKFYRQVFALVIPMALQNLINVGVTAADVLMLGRVSEKVLSGASLAGQIQFVMTLILFGTTSGATVLTAQYRGKKDTQTIEKILGMGMTIGVSCAALFTIVAEIIPEVLLHIYTSDPAVIAEGVKYLRIVALSYVLMAATQVYLYIMRGVSRRVVIATASSHSASPICNVPVNALLIFGLFGLPKMGIGGCGNRNSDGKAIVKNSIIVIWYAKSKNHDVRFHLRSICVRSTRRFWKTSVYASPVILNEMTWDSGSTANTAVIGHLGSAAVAANSVAQVAGQLATVVAFGVSNATAIYLGKTIGAKEFHLAKEYGKRFLWLSIITGAVGGGIILIAAPIANHVMTLSQEAQGYLYFMFFVMSYFTLCQAINTTLVVGVFRAGGDTRFGLILDVSTMWGCSILLGMIAAFVFHAPVQVVYILLMSDEVIKVPITVMRYRSYKWIQNVTREKAELA
ncbi:MAG: MATE family efflux transporter [Coprococcus sp.]